MGREQWAEGGACVAAQLEKGLCKASSPAGSQIGQSGGFGVKDRRADADQGDRDQHQLEGGCLGQ